MSPESRLAPVTQNDFSKGTNLVTNPYDIAKQQSVLIKNMILDEHGSMRTRDGTLILTTSPDVGTIRPIVKLYNFIKQDGTIIELAIVRGVAGNNQLYNRGTSPWTSIGLLGTTYAIPDILTFTDKALIVNGYETPWQYDGTTLSHVTDVPGTGSVPVGGCHHALHQGFYWLWNTAAASSATDGPASLRSSDLNDPNSWPLANQIFIDKDDGDQGMGMGQFTVAESGISPSTAQILFKGFSAYQMSGVFGSTNPLFTIQRIKSDMGCIAPRTIAFAPGFGLIRLSHRGFALFDGVDDRLISEEVRPMIFGAETVGQVVIEPIDWDQVFTACAIVVANPPLYVCLVPVCDMPGLSRGFVYDLVRKAWTIIEFANPSGTIANVRTPVDVNPPVTA